MNVDYTPDPETIAQAEEDYSPPSPVGVVVCGPVQTREVPAAGYPGYRTESVGPTVGVRLLALEPRRKYAVVTCLTSDLWISSSQAGAQMGAGGAKRIPAMVPYPINHLHELWACTVSGTHDVGVETVNWSE